VKTKTSHIPHIVSICKKTELLIERKKKLILISKKKSGKMSLGLLFAFILMVLAGNFVSARSEDTNEVSEKNVQTCFKPNFYRLQMLNSQK
jgi:hypothetical protein